MTTTPYVVGQWVRGPQFYGRSALLRDVLDGPRQALWILGNRRVGKTSLLREIERLTLERSDDIVPLYWDLQGIETPADLAAGLRDAILDREEKFARYGIDVTHLSQDDAISMLRTLKRRLSDHNVRLLLLCDEAEALLALAKLDAKFVTSLGSAFRSGEVQCVMASTIRLWSLAGQHPAFLHDFTPPLYISGLEPAEAADLVRQTHLEPEARPAFDPAQVEQIVDRCGNHPYLLQLLATRALMLGDIEKATNEILFDSMVSHFLTVDFEALSRDEQSVLRLLASSPTAAATPSIGRLPDGSPLEQCLLRLTRLGFLEPVEASHRIPSLFFRHWLQESVADVDEGRSPSSGDDASHLRVGDWSVEPESNLLRNGSEEVKLEPRVMNLLVFLASRPGQVTSKDQIVDAVWDGAFISESALTRAVADLRKALRDDARSPRYLETISKRGYRLIAEVSSPSGAGPGPFETRSRFALVWNGRAHPLSAREFLIGRDSGCSLCMSSGNVSRRHARIVSTGQGATLEDLGSRNGTRVNGEPVTAPRPLADGDEIRIGAEVLVFRDNASPSTTNVDTATSRKDSR